MTENNNNLNEQQLVDAAGGSDQDFDYERTKLLMYFDEFKKYLEKYMTTSTYPGIIQDAIECIETIHLKLMSCTRSLDYLDFKIDWIICKDKLKHAKANEAFNNRFYIMIQEILDKYNIR